MRKRIVGAIAISCEPKILIADEPTTSLDLTIQAQYLKLLSDLQRAHNLALMPTLSGDTQAVLEIGCTILTLRRANGNEDDIRLINRGTKVGRKRQPAVGAIPPDHFLQAGFVDRHLALLEAARADQRGTGSSQNRL